VVFWSPHISLAKHSCSTFTLVDFLCAGEELLPLAGDADEVVSGKSKPMRVELHTGILRLRTPVDGIHF
jgi:hypothetical protein